MITVDVDKSGPIFDGRAAIAVREYIDDAEEELAKVVAGYVREGTVAFRQPTGRARSRVRVVKRARGRIVYDGGLVYWPWLEGVSGRNRSTSFKGYQIWEHATDRAQAEAGEIAARRLPRYARRMG